MAVTALQMPFAKFNGKAVAPGSAGGVVNYAVGGANYARALVTPDNPQSAHQQTVRTYLGLAADAYQSLTTTEAAGWRAEAAKVSRTNPVGGQYSLSGIAYYTMVNFYLQLGGSAINDSAPTPDPVPGPTIINTATVNAGNLDIVLVHATTITVNKFFIRVSRPLASPGRQARDNEFAVLSDDMTDSFPNVTASPMTASIPIEYFTVTTGQRVGIQVMPVSNTGVPGTPTTVRNVLVA